MLAEMMFLTIKVHSHDLNELYSWKKSIFHCWLQNDEADGYVNISFDPGLNETLSPVSSAAQRVCLCDSNGKPQCANISYIFTDTSAMTLTESCIHPHSAIPLQETNFILYKTLETITW